MTDTEITAKSAVVSTDNPVGKPLPVPQLTSTFQLLQSSVDALKDTLGAPVVQQSHNTIAAFIADAAEPHTGDADIARQLQDDLKSFAADREAAGTSWLAEKWLDDYLVTRTSLPLASNVGFQIHVETADTGLGRVAELIHRAALVHLKQAEGTMPQEKDFRGNDIFPLQWECFNGGMRVPAEHIDRIERAEHTVASREIVIYHGGKAWAMQVTDASGTVAAPGAIANQLRTILAHDVDTSDAAAHTSFTAPSYIGSEQLAPLYAEMLDDERNAAVHQRLSGALFCVSLLDDTDEKSTEELLHLSAFQPGTAWVYKPLTYVMGVDSAWLCLHVEHSTIDGATLVAAVKLLQETAVADGTGAGRDAEFAIDELAWHFTEDQSAQLEQAVATVSAQADQYRLNLVHVPTPDLSGLPFKTSADALFQLVLTTAQQLAYGKVRGVYEAVDMREYVAGRTECLRPVTQPAVTLAQALVAGQEITVGMVEAVFAEHRGWVKACKSGNAFDRHFWALRYMAERRDIELPAVFTDEGITAVRTDFLSTSSIGSDQQIVRFAFAPTTLHGFGVNYTPKDGGATIEYLVSSVDDATDQPTAFLGALPQAAELIVAAVAKL